MNYRDQLIEEAILQEVDHLRDSHQRRTLVELNPQKEIEMQILRAYKV